jgi:hypothetical protein
MCAVVGKGLGRLRSSGAVDHLKAGIPKTLSCLPPRGYKVSCDLETEPPFLEAPQRPSRIPYQPRSPPKAITLSCASKRDARHIVQVNFFFRGALLEHTIQLLLFARCTGTATTGSAGWPHLQDSLTANRIRHWGRSVGGTIPETHKLELGETTGSRPRRRLLHLFTTSQQPTSTQHVSSEVRGRINTCNRGRHTGPQAHFALKIETC